MPGLRWVEALLAPTVRPRTATQNAGCACLGNWVHGVASPSASWLVANSNPMTVSVEPTAGSNWSRENQCANLDLVAGTAALSGMGLS
eukprot:CAMPEP_0174370124 /NCGR_PEP_ID=MMETSP0811_2-20130205/95032_1 /TAXON_ID=73025 ORGANISM="Eutreptiella gymnastica-like, Strain CCMP1594" /NCGR_SAMPLE_ID=MMETSP0811_2 /ASSEMBLY_ACC=CAM_ASM_000667 /LENGTH=87 /DNA_ID=CAMNT_0015515231 /DNA_START=166 /DNA_END=432 /DNA_ORIENTATION=-